MQGKTYFKNLFYFPCLSPLTLNYYVIIDLYSDIIQKSHIFLDTCVLLFQSGVVK